ncbi:MAG: cupin domain-containing protein [Pseudomonadota bacterium]
MKKRVRFVILAADPLEALWPVSSIHRPYFLVRGADGLSPFERILLSIKDMAHDTGITVVTSSAYVRDICIQLREGEIAHQDIVAVSSSISQPVLTVMSAMLAARRNRDENLVFVPANLLASSQQRLTDLIRELAAFSMNYQQKIGVPVRPAPKEAGLNNDYPIALARTARAQWSTVEHVLTGDKQPDNALQHQGHYGQPIGIVAASPNSLIECALGTAPIVTQACSHAISMAEAHEGDIFHVRDSFLTLAGKHDIASLFATRPDRLQALLLDDDICAATNWGQPLTQKLAATEEALVTCALVGFSGATRIDYGGRTAVIEPGCEGSVRFPTQSFAGTHALVEPHYTLLHNREQCDVWLLKLPKNADTGTECHFTRTENLQVLEGYPTFFIDGKREPMQPGQQAFIAPGASHRVLNDSGSPVVILETRIGTILDDDDLLRLPDADERLPIGASHKLQSV